MTWGTSKYFYLRKPATEVSEVVGSNQGNATVPYIPLFAREVRPSVSFDINRNDPPTVLVLGR
jgi:hypothetical protein